MITRAPIVATALLAFACSDASNGPAPDGAAPACTASSPTQTLFAGLDVYDALAVKDGFLYMEIPGAGVRRCPTSGCAAPEPVVATDSFMSSTLASTVTYTTQIAADNGGVVGEMHSANVDGSGDQLLLSGLSYPSYVATSGARTFWAEDSFAFDDTPASIRCAGCGSQAVPWITGLGGGTYGLMVDANNVYVLADDASLLSVSLLSCSLQTACLGEPRVVLGRLDRTVTSQQLASDGANVYVARAAEQDIVRIDASGTVRPIVTSESVSAIALDPATGSLYFGTTTGSVAKVPADGSAQPATVACTGYAVAAIAMDAANVYVITGSSGSSVLKMAK